MNATRTLTLTGTAAERRSFIRANQQTMTEITNKDGSKAVEMASYVSHTTTLPPVKLIRNPKYRRPNSPWKFSKLLPGTVNITVNVVTVPVVQTIETIATPDSVPAIAQA